MPPKKKKKKTGKTGRRKPTAADKAVIKKAGDKAKRVRAMKSLEASRQGTGTYPRHGTTHSPMSVKGEKTYRQKNQVDASRGHDPRTIRTGEENTFKEKQAMKKRDAARKKARHTEKTYKQKKAGSTEKTAAQKKATKKRPTRKTKRRYGKPL